MRPRILLIGCGKFGKHHLRVLKQLEKDGEIILEGVVTATKKSSENIAQKYQIKTFQDLNKKLLKSVDAVDIVTPANTHYQLIKKCIPYAHILVEKPLTLSLQEMVELKKFAKKYGKVLMVGHIFRFNNAVKKLREMVYNNQDGLYHIQGKFTGRNDLIIDCGALHTFLHLFDILGYIFGCNPKKIFCYGKKLFNPQHEDYVNVIMYYDSGFLANLELGWIREKKERSLLFRFIDREDIYCNLLNQDIELIGNHKTRMQLYESEPLALEIKYFLELVNGSNEKYPDISAAMEIQKIIDAAYKSMRKNRFVGVES